MRRNGGKVANFRINDNQLGFANCAQFIFCLAYFKVPLVSPSCNKFFFVLV